MTANRVCRSLYDCSHSNRFAVCFHFFSLDHLHYCKMRKFNKLYCYTQFFIRKLEIAALYLEYIYIYFYVCHRCNDVSVTYVNDFWKYKHRYVQCLFWYSQFSWAKKTRPTTFMQLQQQQQQQSQKTGNKRKKKKMASKWNRTPNRWCNGLCRCYNRNVLLSADRCFWPLNEIMMIQVET